jgi:Acyl-CoA reductase (LuxC)
MPMAVTALDLCDGLDRARLLCVDAGVIRVPVLIRGRLVMPEGDAVIEIVETTIDRATMRADGGVRRLLLPRVAAADLTYSDPAAVRARLAAVPFAELCRWLDATAALLEPDAPLGARLRTLVAATSDLADPLLDAALWLNAASLRAAAVREVVDRELSIGAVPGSSFLDEWVEVDAPGWEGATGPLRAALAFGPEAPAPAPRIRALPTLQIHVTAGNAPVVAPASALRLLATRSGGVVKLPAGSILPGAALAVALHAAADAHPAARPVLDALSLVYWRGGDAAIEQPLFDPAVFDRVVVWGAPVAVERVGGLARGIRTLTFDPRYGVSLIGREALADAAARHTAARLAAADVLVWNQRACIASLVHYVEAEDEDAVDRWAVTLRDASPMPTAWRPLRRRQRRSDRSRACGGARSLARAGIGSAAPGATRGPRWSSRPARSIWRHIRSPASSSSAAWRASTKRWLSCIAACPRSGSTPSRVGSGCAIRSPRTVSQTWCPSAVPSAALSGCLTTGCVCSPTSSSGRTAEDPTLRSAGPCC